MQDQGIKLALRGILANVCVPTCKQNRIELKFYRTPASEKNSEMHEEQDFFSGLLSVQRAAIATSSSVCLQMVRPGHTKSAHRVFA